MKGIAYIFGLLVMIAAGLPAAAQTADGTINATIINVSGISIEFNSNPAGVPLSVEASFNSTLDFGNISMWAPVGAGVTRTRNAGAGTFTVSSPFYVRVDVSGVASTGYSLQARVTSALSGYTLALNGTNLTTTNFTVGTNQPYATNISHTVAMTVLTVTAQGAVTPAAIAFTATAN